MADYDKVIPSGQVGEIEVKIYGNKIHAGRFKKSYAVRTNDPEQENVNLILSGNIRKVYDVSSDLAVIGFSDEDMKKEIIFTNLLDRPGYGDSLLVCLLQMDGPMTDEEINYLFNQGVTFYRYLNDYTAIIDVSVQDIFLLVMDMQSFRWIGEYKPEYKYFHEPPESARRGAYVVSLAGDSEEFRNDLKHIGIQVVTYYDETEDYYVVAEWERFPEIASFWWVEKVHKEAESFSSIYVD